MSRRLPSAPGVSLCEHPSGEPNRWTVMVWAGYGADGKPVRAHRNFRGTARQAVEFGVELRREIIQRPPDRDHHSIGSWFEEVFLPHRRALAERGQQSPTTVMALEKKYRRHVQNHPITRLELAKLDTGAGPAHLVRWFNDVATTPRADGGRYSPKTLQHVLSMMMSGLRYAVSVGPLEKDPFRKFPRELRPRIAPKGRPSQRSIGSAGQRAIRGLFAGTELDGPVTLALLGLRRGEILGVRIRGGEEDPRNGDLVLDGPRPLVRVRQVVIDAEGGARIKACPKSASSRRDIALPGWAVKVLRESKRRALELRLESGDRWQEHDLLFPSRGRHRHPVTGTDVGWGAPGRPQQPTALYKRFKARLAELEIDGFEAEQVRAIRLHDLRHTYVSVLINEVGMRAEDVQRLAGHADLKTTQGYRAEDPEPGARAADALDELLAIDD